jgi:hypothetical protein
MDTLNLVLCILGAVLLFTLVYSLLAEPFDVNSLLDDLNNEYD